jgi:hypothetical protein
VPFKSGGEVMTNLLGGHVDAAWANPSECIGQLEAGQVRALGVGDEERLRGLPKIQTMKELGVPMVSNQWRALGGPANLPKPVVFPPSDRQGAGGRQGGLQRARHAEEEVTAPFRLTAPPAVERDRA